MFEKTIKIKFDSSGAERGVTRLDGKLKKLDKSADTSKAKFGALKASVIAVAAALQVRVIAQYADQFTSIQNQIRQTTNSTEELTKRTADLLGVANRSRVEFAATSELYTNLVLSTENLNLSTQEQIRLTETIAKSFSVSGKSAAESAGAIRQLGQAFAAGALRGDEFNSIAEGAPEIMRALQRSLKKTQGELREFAATGGITSKILVEALSGAASVIDEKMSKAVKTLGQSFQEAENNAINFIGSSENVSAVMGLAGDAVVALSENLDKLVLVAITLSSVYGSKLLVSLVRSTAASVSKTIATTALAKSEQAAALSALATAKAEQAATVAMFNASVGATKASIAANQLAAANTRLAAAAGRASLATKALGASASIASRGLALLGGPIGIIAIAATSLVLFGDSQSDAELETIELTKAVDDQIASLKNLGKTQKDLSNDKLKTIKDRIAELTKQIVIADRTTLESATSMRRFGTGIFTASGRAAGLRKELDELFKQKGKLEELADAIDSAESGGGKKKEDKEPDLKREKANDDFARRFQKIQDDLALEREAEINSEQIKTKSLKVQLNERRTVQAAFNSLMLQDFKSLADEERAITEFNRKADLAGVSAQQETTTVAFARRREEILANEALDAKARGELKAELRAQELSQNEIFEIEKIAIERDAATEIAQIAQAEADLKMQITTGNATAILGAISALGKGSLKIQKAVALASSGVAIATGIARANELGYPANIAEIARVVALGAKVFSTIKGAKVGSAATVGGASSGSGSGSSSSPIAQRREPIEQSRVVEIRGLSEIAEELRNLDPGEVLPVEYTQRIVASLDEFNRLGGE